MISADAGGYDALGPGSGMMPTGSAVVGDIVDIARNILTNAKQRIPILSYRPDVVTEKKVMPVDDITTYYYFRFAVLTSQGCFP